VSFVVVLDATPAKLLAQAAARRAVTPELLIEEIASGVAVRGHIEKQRSFWFSWEQEQRTVHSGKRRQPAEV
jgi:hypothetical protein